MGHVGGVQAEGPVHGLRRRAAPDDHLVDTRLAGVAQQLGLERPLHPRRVARLHPGHDVARDLAGRVDDRDAGGLVAAERHDDEVLAADREGHHVDAAAERGGSEEVAHRHADLDRAGVGKR
ncbi:hypothetical protein [Streptosporangium sp. NPDC051022]|uniref:hypothetical protein n=1 Tax=Streptosporangium sp. NPDC051022 TaxID=3155752 RepID=UPI0034417E9E